MLLTMNKPLAVIFGLLSVLIWSTQSSVSVLAIRQGWTSVDLTAARFCGALLVAIPWLFFIHGDWQGINWRRLLTLSVFAGAPFTLVNIAGLQFAPVTHAAAISLGFVPIIIGLLSRPLLKKNLYADQWLTLLLLLMAVSIVWHGTGLNLNYLLGDICFLVGAILWALYAIYVQRWQLKPAEAMFFASLGSTPFLVWYVLFADWPKWDNTMMALQVGYQGFLVGLGALYLYGQTIRILGPQLGTLFTAMVPVCIPLIASLLIDYQTSLSEYIGLAIVITAMLMAFYRPVSCIKE